VLVGTALAIAAGQQHLISDLAALLGALLIQIGTNLANDVSDYDSGADDAGRIGPPRVTQRGWVRPSVVAAAAGVAFFGAALVGIYLVARGGWPIVAIGLASIACAIGYTARPVRFGYRGFGDVAVLVFFGPVAVCGTYYVQAHALPFVVAYASLGVGALITAILVVNNIRDRHGDRAAGKRTLAVLLGLRASRWEYTVLVLSAYLLLPLAPLMLSQGFGWLLPLVSLPLALDEVHRLWVLDGGDLNPSLGRTARLGLIYSVLLSIGVLL
jgi:1,4-dihydroxy-2-naphthoate octaprenyltransferase